MVVWGDVVGRPLPTTGVVTDRERSRIVKSRWTYVAIGLAIVVFLVACGAKSSNPAANAKWEYKVVSHMKLAGMKSVDEVWEKAFEAMSFEGSQQLNNEMSAQMNQLGNEGWELVCYGKETGFVFKRMK